MFRDPCGFIDASGRQKPNKLAHDLLGPRQGFMRDPYTCAASELKMSAFAQSTSWTAKEPVPLWVTINSCDRLTTVSAFKVVITPCTFIYRFVHTSGRLENAVGTLGFEDAKSAGFSA